VTYADPQCVDIAYHNNYIILNNNFLLSGAIYSSTNISITEQSNQIFRELGDILANEDYNINNIVRQWNYIENITSLSPEGQNYQQFNDARSEFYSKTTWKNGYPAATGIGTACGGVTVVVDALRNSGICSEPIDNPLQISAHAYSQKVLINNNSAPNKTTPKFERARRVECKEMEAIYISGTAAIRGEESCTDSDIISQIKVTMENIEQLTSQKDSKHKNDSQEVGYENSMLRIYLKHRSNWPQVKQWIADNCANVETLCIEADICRSELLVEIEGIANKIIQNR
ncbi:MAG: endoribonuclease L-PSP, partial [Alistipes sp.]|nr:endoribonuclease L-PSP [Alistipes sp.]